MKKKESILFFVGLILFFIILFDIYLWIQISSDYSKSLEQVKKEYQEKLPWFLAKGQRVALFNILLLTTAAFLLYKASFLNKIKIISRIFFILCIVIGMRQLFTLM